MPPGRSLPLQLKTLASEQRAQVHSGSFGDLARGARLGQHRRVQRRPPNPSTVELSSEAHAELDGFLSERIYEFNSATTGIFDGEVFAGSITDPAGAVIAG